MWLEKMVGVVGEGEGVVGEGEGVVGEGEGVVRGWWVWSEKGRVWLARATQSCTNLFTT